MTYLPFRHLSSIFWKNKPIQLTFFLTRRCNAKCPFCFYLSRKYDALHASSSEELTLSEIKKIATSLGNLLWLAFSGGEIFLRSDIVDIAQLFYKTNKPVIMLFPTNGLLTEVIYEKIETILNTCPRTNIVAKISLDGPKPVHDKIRGVVDAYDKTLQTYQALGGLLEKYPNFDLGINTVFCSENQDCMLELIDFASNLEPVTTHTISLIRGDALDNRAKKVDLTKYQKAVLRLESNLKKKKAPTYGFGGARVKAAQDILQRRMIYETATQNRQLLPCYAGKLNLVLTESGDIYPCESFRMKLGNVRNVKYDIGRIIESEQAQKTILSIEENQCFCTHECYFMTNILFNPRHYPALFKEYLQL